MIACGFSNGGPSSWTSPAWTGRVEYADPWVIVWQSEKQTPPPSPHFVTGLAGAVEEFNKAKRHWLAVRRTRLEQIAESDRAILLCRKTPPERPVLAWPCPQLVHRERAHRRANPVPDHPRAAHYREQSVLSRPRERKTTW